VSKYNPFLNHDYSSRFYSLRPWCPVNFEYKPDAKHYIRLVVAQVGPDTDDLAGLQELVHMLQVAKAGELPQSVLNA
jgi:hypothetical protein